MANLQKAVLTKLRKGSVVKNITVQFNPTSLRIAISNTKDTAETQNQQHRQFTGKSSMVLSLDLIFDTADTGRNVRELTAEVADLITPQPPQAQAKQVAPSVRFSWGTIVVAGTLESYQEELDLFSVHGVPLRAKLSITLKGQEGALAQEPDADSGAGARDPQRLAPGVAAASDALGGGGGSGPRPDRTAAAIGGETAADFAARMGLDPAAWRALRPSPGSAGAASGLPSLELPAGMNIDFPSSVSAQASLGGGAGVGLAAATALDQAAAALAGSLAERAPAGELSVSAQAPASSSELASALALTSAGGAAHAAGAAEAVRASVAVARAVSAFAPASTTPVASASRVAGQLLARSAQARPSASASPRSDTRAFGRGLPLRPSATRGLEQELARARGDAPLRRAATPQQAGRVPSWRGAASASGVRRRCTCCASQACRKGAP